MPTSNDATFIQNFQDGGRIPEVVITLRQKTTPRCSQRLQQCFSSRPIHFHRFRQYLTSDREQYQVQTGSRNSTQNRMFAPDAVYWRRTLSIQAQPDLECPKHCSSPWDRVDICFRFWVISTSGLYMMVFSEIGYCRNRWKWIGRGLKHCLAAESTLMSFSVAKL